MLPPLGGPHIYTTLREHIGLKMQAQKTPVDVYIIDKVESRQLISPMRFPLLVPIVGSINAHAFFPSKTRLSQCWLYPSWAHVPWWSRLK